MQIEIYNVAAKRKGHGSSSYDIYAIDADKTPDKVKRCKMRIIIIKKKYGNKGNRKENKAVNKIDNKINIRRPRRSEKKPKSIRPTIRPIVCKDIVKLA